MAKGSMRRKLALEHMRIAGAQNDRRAFTRLLCENRVSYDVAMEAWQIGQRQAQPATIN